MSNTQATLLPLPAGTLYKGFTLKEWAMLRILDQEDRRWLAYKFEGDIPGLKAWLKQED
jgi:hypothetical protein